MKKKNQTLFLASGLSLAVWSIIAHPVFAACTTPPCETLDNPLKNEDIPHIINDVIGGILGVVGAIALLMFVYGGFLWLTARGEEKQVKQGWDTMTWAALGIAVIFGSYAVVRVILGALVG